MSLRPTTKSPEQDGVGAGDNGQRRDETQHQLRVDPGTADLGRQLQDKSTSMPAAEGCHRGADRVRQRSEQRHEPDADANTHTDRNSSKSCGVVVAGQTSINAECNQRQYAGVLVGLAEHVRQLADCFAEHPVGQVRRHAVERKCTEKQFVGRRQVEDVVVADGLVSYLGISTETSASSCIVTKYGAWQSTMRAIAMSMQYFL